MCKLLPSVRVAQVYLVFVFVFTSAALDLTRESSVAALDSVKTRTIAPATETQHKLRNSIMSKATNAAAPHATSRFLWQLDAVMTAKRTGRVNGATHRLKPRVIGGAPERRLPFRLQEVTFGPVRARAGCRVAQHLQQRARVVSARHNRVQANHYCAGA